MIRFCPKCLKIEVIDKYSPKCECKRKQRGAR